MINTEVIDPEVIEIIQTKSSTIKCLALIDIFFAFIYIFASPFFALSAFICVCMSVIGYNGAKNYNKTQTLSYNIYLVIQNIFRVIIFFIYIFHPEYFGIENIDGVAIFMNSLIIIINLYINYYVFSFYKTIKSFDQELLTSLTTRSNIVILHGEIV